MDARIDLDAASRDELIALIVQQQTVIGRLERRIAQLEDNAKPGGPSGMPGLKPRSSPKPPAPQQPRKPRPQGFSRRRMAPTHRVLMFTESVLANWPAEMSHSTYGECDFDSKRTDKTSGSEQFAR